MSAQDFNGVLNISIRTMLVARAPLTPINFKNDLKLEGHLLDQSVLRTLQSIRGEVSSGHR